MEYVEICLLGASNAFSTEILETRTFSSKAVGEATRTRTRTRAAEKLLELLSLP